MQSPSDDDRTMIETVNSHLEQLASLSRFDSGQAKVRVASASLRFLLVEGMLGRAWKASGLGGPMTFRAWCVDKLQGDGAVAFCGGGGVLPGVPFSVCFNATLVERSLDLAALCGKTRIQAGTAKVSTIELIQYVANTLGGSRYDPRGKSPKSRKPSFDLLRRLHEGALGGLSLRIGDRDLVHHELLSVAGVLVASPEVGCLMAWRPAVT
jgi:hypothetical protein